MISIKIGENVYTKKQVKEFLEDVYVSDIKPNIAIWMPEDNVITYKLVFESSLISSEESSVSANNIFLDILKVYAELTQLKFENAGSSKPDIVFVFSEEFKELGKYDFIKNVALNSKSTEKHKADYKNSWDKIDDEVNGFTTQFETGQFFVEQGEANNLKVSRAYQLARTTEVESKKFYKIASRAVCNSFLHPSKVGVRS